MDSNYFDADKLIRVIDEHIEETIYDPSCDNATITVGIVNGYLVKIEVTSDEYDMEDWNNSIRDLVYQEFLKDRICTSEVSNDR